MSLADMSINGVCVRKRLDANPADVCTAVTPDMVAPLILLYHGVALRAPMNILSLPTSPLLQQRVCLLHLDVLVNFPLETRYALVWESLTRRTYRAETRRAMERRGIIGILRGELIESCAVGGHAELELLRVNANVGVKCQLEKVLQLRMRENLPESVYWDRRQTFHTGQNRVLVCDSGGQEMFQTGVAVEVTTLETDGCLRVVETDGANGVRGYGNGFEVFDALVAEPAKYVGHLITTAPNRQDGVRMFDRETDVLFADDGPK